MNLQALLWDVDGTLAETERDGHLVAFNLAFQACGLPWRWGVERYGHLLSVTGGRERLLYDMADRAEAPKAQTDRQALAQQLHQHKNDIYADLVRSHRIALRPGVAALLAQCRTRGMRMAIATTTSRANVDALLHAHIGADWPAWFGAVVCGEDVAKKKPDPEVYQLAIHLLELNAADTLALEDSPAGVAAARATSVPVVVTRSVYFADEAFDDDVVAVGPGLGERTGWRPAAAAEAAQSSIVGLDDLIAWHDAHALGMRNSPQILLPSASRR
jgi:HAD superfamily hydrolase (TIGR01509 family)